MRNLDIDAEKKHLSLLYFSGKYEKTYDFAIELAKKYEPYAIWILGNLYEFGNGIDINLKKAIEHYELALYFNEYHAALSMAMLFDPEMIGRDVPLIKDVNKARTLYLKAYELSLSLAKEGDAEAMYYVGLTHNMNGKINEAIDWFERAYKNEFYFALGELNSIYSTPGSPYYDPNLANKYKEILFDKIELK